MGLAIFELVGRAFLWLRPTYEVVFLQPDRAVGWKRVPNHQFIWAGSNWYASDFSVAITSNSLGFRDTERAASKPPGVVRVALLGDSFIEALQVPLERTAGQVLEARLNGHSADLGGSRYEVLNLGISNFGIGQYLLVWQAYARDFQPDYVVAWIAEFLMRRTVQRDEDGAFRSTLGRRLWVRPTFRLQRGRLIFEPARDFDSFVRAQEELLLTHFEGTRSRVRERSILHHVMAGYLADARPTMSVPLPARPFAPPSVVSDFEIVEVNLAILRELGSHVRLAGGTFIVADASGFMPGEISDLSERLKEFCSREHFRYVPVYEPMMSAQHRGVPLTWARDGHLNQAGNAILGNALADGIGDARSEGRREDEQQREREDRG